MNQKTFFLVSGIIYSAVAILHALRIAYRWEATIGGWALPMSISVIGLVVAGYLAYSAFSLSRSS